MNAASFFAPVFQEIIVNGYQIGKLDGGGWFAVKVGESRGKSFKNKKSAVLFAQNA